MKNQKLIQALGDLAIPLMGYFWWNWSLYFIALFYMLDLLFNEVFCWIKSSKIKDKNQATFQYKTSSIFIFLAIISVLHLLLAKISPEINFMNEMLAFLKYKDMGIEQGYILIPLLIFVNYQRYKLEFVGQKMADRLKLSEFWKHHLQTQILILVWTVFLFAILLFIPLKQAWILTISILGPFVFQIYQRKKEA